MRRQFASLVLAGVFVAVSATVFGAEKGVKITEVTFEPEAHRLWDRLLADNDYIQNLPRSYTRSLQEHIKVVQWLDTCVLTPASSQVQNSNYVVTFTSGPIPATLATRILGGMLDSLVDRGDVDAIQAKRSKIEAEIAKLEDELARLEELADAGERRSDEALKGRDVTQVRTELEQVDADLYATNLELVQVEARLDVLRKNLGELTEFRSQGETWTRDLRREIDQLDQYITTPVAGQDRASQEEVRRLENVKQVLMGAARDLSDLARRVGEITKPLYLDLKQKLVDAETQFAGLTAKRKFVAERRDQLQRMLDERAELLAPTKLTRANARSVQGALRELRHALASIDPHDFPVPQPVIVWADIPEDQR